VAHCLPCRRSSSGRLASYPPPPLSPSSVSLMTSLVSLAITPCLSLSRRRLLFRCPALRSAWLFTYLWASLHITLRSFDETRTTTKSVYYYYDYPSAAVSTTPSASRLHTMTLSIISCIHSLPITHSSSVPFIINIHIIIIVHYPPVLHFQHALTDSAFPVRLQFVSVACTHHIRLVASLPPSFEFSLSSFDLTRSRLI